MKYILKVPLALYLCILGAFGLFLRFWDISKASIWHDEGYTLMLINYDPIEIIQRTARDVHPPLFYLLLHGWTQVFGTSELGARSFAALCTAAIIPFTYLFIRRLYQEKTARLAALFAAVGPFLVRYGQEARMYGMVALLGAIATYALVKALQQDGNRWWAAYSLTVAAAMYTHYYSVFIVLIHVIYVALHSSKKRKSGLFNHKWWFSCGTAFLLFVPWLPVAIHQFMRVQQSFWIPAPIAETLPNTLIEMLRFQYLGTQLLWLTYAISALFVFLCLGLLIAQPHKRRDNDCLRRVWPGFGSSHIGPTQSPHLRRSLFCVCGCGTLRTPCRDDNGMVAFQREFPSAEYRDCLLVIAFCQRYSPCTPKSQSSNAQNGRHCYITLPYR